MPLIFFEREGKTVSANSGWNLRKLARKNDINVYSGVNQFLNCRGNGLCGTCKVEIFSNEEGAVSPRTAMEEKKLKKFSNPNLRLSCQVVVHGNIRVKTPPVELMRPDRETVAPPMVSRE